MPGVSASSTAGQLSGRFFCGEGSHRWLRLALLGCGFSLLAGCGSLVGEKRHTPAEIARYQPADFSAEIASASGRDAAHRKAREAIQRARFGAVDDAGVVEALHAVRFLNTAPEDGLAILLAALPTLPGKAPAVQREVLSAAHASFPRESVDAVLAVLPQIGTPREFAIGAYSVLRGDSARKSALLALLDQRFPDADAREEPRLIALRHALTVDRAAELTQRPPLVDLLAAPFRAGKPVLFSFQRKDRRHFGLAVVRGADGRFVRQSDGTIFNVAQLAMALTDLPGTITNGNTPQGVFAVVGAGTATNPWIGPTPYLHSKIPIEASVADYEQAAGFVTSNGAPSPSNANNAAEWSMAIYESFLPASWRNYFPAKEVWLAGRAGRDEMLSHGTTIQPDLYRNTPWYPGTPSAGCLVAMEYWDNDGRLVHSDQLALIKAFTAGGLDYGYLMVVELDDQRVPVSLAEVMPDLLAAEARLGAR